MLTRKDYEKTPAVPKEAVAVPKEPKPQRCHWPDTCRHLIEAVDGKWYCEACGWADPEPKRCMTHRPGAGYTPIRCVHEFKLLEMPKRLGYQGRQKFCGLHSPSRLQAVRDKHEAERQEKYKGWNERQRAEEQAAEAKRRAVYLAELGFSSEEQAKRARLSLEVGKLLSTTSSAFFLYLANWRDNEEILSWPHFKAWSEAQGRAHAFFEGEEIEPCGHDRIWFLAMRSQLGAALTRLPHRSQIVPSKDPREMPTIHSVDPGAYGEALDQIGRVIQGLTNEVGTELRVSEKLYKPESTEEE